MSVEPALLAAAAVFAIIANTTFVEEFSSSRLLLVLLALFLVHALLVPRILFCRELALYAGLFGYNCLTLLWAPDVALALNTLFPMLDALLLMVLFGSLTAFYDTRAVLTGALVGFAFGALGYTYLAGFPFSVPADFSYNAIATMYVFGLMLALLYGWVRQRTLVPLMLAVVIWLHVAATTSIKTNMGIVLGVISVVFCYPADWMRGLRRAAIPMAIAGGILAVYIASNAAMLDRLQFGLGRLLIGAEVLENRENVQGYSGFSERTDWAHKSLTGFVQNPVFGEGTEAFRSRNGITSHSTPADLAYNTGIIGFALFYGMVAVLLWRLRSPSRGRVRQLHALVLGGVVCWVFMSLSGTLLYSAFMAGFVGISAGLLRRIGGEESCALMREQRANS